MKTESLHPVELLALAAMALVWALATITRLLLPLLAMLITLVRHHRLEQPLHGAAAARIAYRTQSRGCCMPCNGRNSGKQ